VKRNTFYLLTHYVVLSTLPSHDQGQNADSNMLLCHTSVTIIYTDKVRVKIKATVLIISLCNLIYKSSGRKKRLFFFLFIVKQLLVSYPLSYHTCKTSIINTLLQWREGGLSLGMEVWEWEFGNAADRSQTRHYSSVTAVSFLFNIATLLSAFVRYAACNLRGDDEAAIDCGSCSSCQISKALTSNTHT